MMDYSLSSAPAGLQLASCCLLSQKILGEKMEGLFEHFGHPGEEVKQVAVKLYVALCEATKPDSQLDAITRKFSGSGDEGIGRMVFKLKQSN